MAFDTSTNFNNDAFDWGDSIIDDGASQNDKPSITLPEGDYDFKVIKFTKTTQKPSPKIPNGCCKAELLLKVSTPEGDSLINENLFLIRSMEWKLSAFLRSIGQKKHGEPCHPDWNAVNGSTGKAHFKVEEFVDREGKQRTKNVVERFLDADSTPWVE